MRLSCPECGHRAWRYKDDIWTCRNGHKSRYPEPGEPTYGLAALPEPEPRRWPSWLPWTAVGALAAADIAVHLLA